MDLLTKIGSLSGLASGIFLVWDRFMAGQPLVWPARQPNLASHIRFLRCTNVSKWDILIRKIKVVPDDVLIISRDDSEDAVVGAYKRNDPFEALIPAGETRDFPLGIRGGDEVSSPFVIIVSWRSARSTGLPKVPVFVFSSLRALRAMK
jgi:hypothetical protein